MIDSDDFRRISHNCACDKMAAKQAADQETPLVHKFRNASEVMRNVKGLRLSNEQKLNVYALFKQVSS